MVTTERLGLTDALVRLAHLVDQVFGDVSREHGLTPQQTQLLCLLVHGPVGMTELSRLLDLERSSLSGLVDRVERRGLITRVREQRDRRACNIALTEPGVRLAADSHQGVTAQLEALTGRLAPADRELLASALARLLTEDVVR